MAESLRNKVSAAIFRATNLFLLRHWDKTAYGTILGGGLWALSQIFSPLVATWTFVSKEALNAWNLILGCVLVVNLRGLIGVFFNKHQFRPEIEELFQSIAKANKEGNLSSEQVQKLYMAVTSQVIKNTTLKDDVQTQLEQISPGKESLEGRKGK
ncbi:hypothetical protein [Thalassomonas haliotis]|uniref:GTPase n=1 Tax=Thalassomonas haliotis TaxID=485448 RepID=A0ABY7V9K7_9GAMM|nr:hypothetical protein [Thalassomonas haliotis]WDE09578.1 hypothetical protein H3N35_14665 [Thalassomonas haliotis]